MSVRAARFDFVELRLDALENPTVEQIPDIVRACNTAIVTMRPSDHFDELQRERVLRAAIEAGPAYLDAELDMPSYLRTRLTALARDCGTRLIISFHSPAGCPPIAQLRARLAQARALEPAFVKIACSVSTEEESKRLLTLLREGPDVIPVGLGPLALSCRVAAMRAKVAWTYAAEAAGLETAFGQPDLNSLVEAMSRP
jgi:3-dehydroquinate dehydratase type I